VICIGECMVELRAAGADAFAGAYAGDAYNTAVYLKRSLPDGCGAIRAGRGIARGRARGRGRAKIGFTSVKSRRAIGRQLCIHFTAEV
jgi:hypothetical protein